MKRLCGADQQTVYHVVCLKGGNMQTPLYSLFAFPWYSPFCHLLIGASKSNQDWSGKSVPTHKKVKHVTQFTCFDVYYFARFESSSC